ncbi:MAG TPA: protoglobin domain-containing protein [Terriglobia bacterium]|nr:protoglobin domain-containing protein [Terriglobia bacterium]
MELGIQPDYMKVLKLDDEECRRRLEFFELTDEDFQRLMSLRPFAERWTQEITEGLYELIMKHPESRSFFPDDATLARVKRLQNAYFLHLFSGTYDLNYLRDRLRVGSAHERIGMPPKLYLGAYRRYLALIHEKLRNHFKGNEAEAVKAIETIRKIIFFDMAIAIDTYIAAYLETMTRHQAAIRELSTPVIKVYDRILLLPIVGTVDTQRANQIMETVLVQVVEQQAKVIIIDIAGVPVVDTKVADHILQTTAAVRLLGAQTVLTGISASVARTVVQLGVELTQVDTRAKLSEGIELALSLVGKKISSKSKSDADNQD